tara:strand:- start:84 stop:227 length:144 start_codon:yes stop_codon:yes gene_type:complete
MFSDEFLGPLKEGISGKDCGERVACEGGAVALGPLFWPCNQSDILEV